MRAVVGACVLTFLISLVFQLIIMEFTVASIVAFLPIASKRTYLPLRIAANLCIVFLGGEIPSSALAGGGE